MGFSPSNWLSQGWSTYSRLKYLILWGSALLSGWWQGWSTNMEFSLGIWLVTRMKYKNGVQPCYLAVTRMKPCNLRGTLQKQGRSTNMGFSPANWLVTRMKYKYRVQPWYLTGDKDEVQIWGSALLSGWWQGWSKNMGFSHAQGAWFSRGCTSSLSPGRQQSWTPYLYCIFVTCQIAGLNPRIYTSSLLGSEAEPRICTSSLPGSEAEPHICTSSLSPAR